MTRSAILTDLSALGVRVSASGDRLHVEAAKGVLTPDLLAMLRAHKAELLAALGSRGVGDCFDGGDMKERKRGHALGQVPVVSAVGDDQAALDENRVLRVGYVVPLAAGRDDAERLERLLPQKPLKQFDGHAPIISPDRPNGQSRPVDANPRRDVLGVSADRTDAGGSPNAGRGNAGDLPAEWREHFAERAAIMEADALDAHPTREAADRAAWADTIRQTVRWQDQGWITGDRLAALPADLQGLVMPREGWTPEAWADRLLYLSDLCAELNPDIADLYRRAADLLPNPPADNGAGTGGKKSRYGA